MGQKYLGDFGSGRPGRRGARSRPGRGGASRVTPRGGQEGRMGREGMEEGGLRGERTECGLLERNPQHHPPRRQAWVLIVLMGELGRR
jgi:hypothetical protein